MPSLRAHKNKTPSLLGLGVLSNKSLTMTYFHRRTSTIIGAKAFHGPVRDGKEWDHLAMVVKRNRLPRGPFLWGATQPIWEEAPRLALSPAQGCNHDVCVFRGVRAAMVAHWSTHSAAFVLFERHLNTYNLQGYRIKPHGQLVLVSYTHY